jgi:hemerythrin-like metal-binding protein
MKFSKELSVGNRILDGEHKKLHEIINGMIHAVASRDVTMLVEAFELLENSLYAYFAVEENIALAVDFDFEQHRLVHQGLLYKFRHIKNELLTRNDTQPALDDKHYIDALKNCLIRHIKVDDKPLKAVLETHFYDFKPDSAVNPECGYDQGSLLF